jgi:uncharacterized protein (TIGR02646 family)
MLKLSNPVQYTVGEENIISEIYKTKLSGKDRWNDSRAKSIKHKISTHCLREQNCRCAYCELLLDKGNNAIEHISPKSITENFTFEPLNLVVSCSRCNCGAVKGDKETIVGDVDSDYKNNQFKIVHPRLDDPSQHFVYMDDSRIVFDRTKCSKKALDTIDFFEWDAIDAVTNRQRAFLESSLTIDISQLINEISTYK